MRAKSTFPYLRVREGVALDRPLVRRTDAALHCLRTARTAAMRRRATLLSQTARERPDARRDDPSSAASGRRKDSAARSPTPMHFEALIRRVGAELVIHGHNHRLSVVHLEGPGAARCRSSASHRPRRSAARRITAPATIFRNRGHAQSTIRSGRGCAGCYRMGGVRRSAADRALSAVSYPSLREARRQRRGPNRRARLDRALALAMSIWPGYLVLSARSPCPCP